MQKTNWGGKITQMPCLTLGASGHFLEVKAITFIFSGWKVDNDKRRY